MYLWAVPLPLLPWGPYVVMTQTVVIQCMYLWAMGLSLLQQGPSVVTTDSSDSVYVFMGCAFATVATGTVCSYGGHKQ